MPSAKTKHVHNHLTSPGLFTISGLMNDLQKEYMKYMNMLTGQNGTVRNI